MNGNTDFHSKFTVHWAHVTAQHSPRVIIHSGYPVLKCSKCIPAICLPIIIIHRACQM